jgi:dinuclear metal center YbgI/SA1388 family protein
MANLLKELLSHLERLAPLRYAEAWDNVGLLVGEESQAVSRVLLTIDYTAAVAAEGREQNCDCIISYHPPIFHPLKRIDGESLIYDAIRRGVAIYSPHTALDVAEGGTNDVLADAMGLVDRRALRATAGKSEACKLVVFVPTEAAEKVATAVFAAGAGRGGNYSRCSFQSKGTGTFFGEAESNPAIGMAGRLEEVEELRWETLVPTGRIDAVIAAMREAHPYEEPAFDLVPLVVAAEGKGQGRIGKLDRPTGRAEVFGRIKKELGLGHLLIAGPTSGMVSTAACCAGACGEMVNDALAQKAELYLTGEMRHHDALRAAEKGMTVVCTLHSHSERAVLKRWAERLREQMPAVQFVLSQVDRDPFLIS